MLVFAVLVFGLAQAQGSGPALVSLEGSCTAPESIVCAEVLLGSPSALYWVPHTAVFSDGESVALSPSVLENVASFGLELAESLGAFVGSECRAAMWKHICFSSFQPCEERGGESVPVKDCEDLCINLWARCQDTYTLALQYGYSALTPNCGLFDGPISFRDSEYSDLETLEFGMVVPAPLLGSVVYSPSATYDVVMSNGASETFTCRTDRAESVLANVGASPSGNASVCLSKTMCKWPWINGALDEAGCDTCALICPLNPFPEDVSLVPLANIERLLAQAAIPLLVVLLFFEISAKDRNPFIVISGTLGLAYSGLSLFFVDASVTGCDPGGGGFPAHQKGPWWSSTPELDSKCFLMTLTVHLLQGLLMSMLCFFIEMRTKFVRAVSFQARYERRKFWPMYLFLIVGVPAMCATITVVMGQPQGGVIVRAGSLAIAADFSWNTVRHLFKCGPAFDSYGMEVAVVVLPLVLPVVACGVIALKLSLLCRRILGVARTQTRTSALSAPSAAPASQARSSSSSAQVRQTSRLARQMLGVSTCCSGLLSLQIVTEAYLRDVFVHFSNNLAGLIFCSSVEDIRTFAGCSITSHLSATHLEVVKLNLATWSAIPLLFGSLFLTTLCLKLRARHATKIKPRSTTTNRSVKPTDSTRAVGAHPPPMSPAHGKSGNSTKLST